MATAVALGPGRLAVPLRVLSAALSTGADTLVMRIDRTYADSEITLRSSRSASSIDQSIM